ncbi:MAG TPA: hypothetical protein VGF17_24615 [Phytomonospora sp.]
MSYDYAYAKKWRLDRQRGITRYVDPAPTIAHVEQLLAAGLSKRAIAEAAGVSAQVITELTRHQPKHVTRTVAARILAVRVEHGHQRQAPRGFVPAIGARRRIRALQAIGHPAAAIAEAAGVTVNVVNNISVQAGDWITAANRDAIHRAYEQLWSTPGPSAKVRGIAAKRGWAPPMAWDDDTIDHPDAQPDLGVDRRTGRGRNQEDLVEDVEDLLRFEPLATAEQLAVRLGYADRSGVQNALDRAGRQDLLDHLARNARLHQEGTAA